MKPKPTKNQPKDHLSSQITKAIVNNTAKDKPKGGKD